MSTISEMYPIPPEIKRLHVFLGDWNAEGTIKIGDNKLKLEGKWRFSTAAGGWGLKSANKFEVEELDTYELDNLFGFDRETGTLHIYSLTNMAETHDHTASWSDENTLKGGYEGLKDGKKFREDFTIKLVSPDEITIDYIEKVDDQIDSIMNVILKK
ncbi:TPA: hypothetical protein HA338_11015 [Methanosarcina acetivorans]|uniref:DUF1579 domain-containing protein n=2 Tax=Methanosarcina acetivorans TaxID=2214 RepID=Q8TTG9_METAC|nr:hypothetical protein [Methanosarcina acetivorans]AAM03912.1 predicted protein [Methanosarcina acetivorans C2A]HIH94525.1 hypothetical protein [Methanosarcina acetivorans]